MKHRLIALAPYLIWLGALFIRLIEPAWLEEMQLRTFDAFNRIHPRAYQETAVRIVDIDDESLAKLGQWPWPRTFMARLVDRLKNLGAAVIGFDIVFAEPDRTSPGQVLPLWPATPAIDALKQDIQSLPDHDKIFGESIGQAPVVTGFALTSEANETRPALKAGFAYAGDAPERYLRVFSGAVACLPDLEKEAAGNGSFTVMPDPDGMIRRLPFMFSLKGRMVPSFAAEALRVAEGASTYKIKSSGASGEKSFGQHTGLVEIGVGRFRIPTDAEGRIWLYDTGPAARRSIPVWKILENDFKKDGIEGTIVLIGTSAAGLKDIRATPLNPAAAGIEIHAQLLEQILNKQFLKRPDWSAGAEVAFLALFGLLLVWLLPKIGAAGCAFLALTAVLGIFGFSWRAFLNSGWLVDPVYPSLSALAIYLVSSLAHFLKIEAERREIRTAFSRYLSPVLVDRLAKDPSMLKLGGEKKEMTILFADIRNFTAMSEQMEAQALTQFINRFLTPMTDIIMKHGGTIDKYMGDCVMAFWNAPLAEPEHAARAGRAALEMQAHLAKRNRGELSEEAGAAGFKVRAGIGINTGECFVGNMGSGYRFDYSVIGDEVNLASRLEGQCKHYGVDIIAGERTAERAAGLAWLEIDKIQVVGKTRPVRIFALFEGGEPGYENYFPFLKTKHLEMLEAYRASAWDRAETLVRECLTIDKAGKLAVFYSVIQKRIEAFRVKPPDPNWLGTFTSEGK